MKNQERYMSYLIDLIPIIQEKRQQLNDDNLDDNYINGQLQGYNNSLNYMKKLAIESQLPVNVLGLDVVMRYQFNINEFKNEDCDKYKKYLPQLVNYIFQELITSKQNNDLISQGRLFAYYDILTIMKEQAELAFEIDDIGFRGKNIEEYAFA